MRRVIVSSERWVEIVPAEARCLVSNLGNALRRRAGDPRGAERAYREALAAQPNFAPALQNLGNLLREMDRVTTKRSALLEQAVRISGSPESHLSAWASRCFSQASSSARWREYGWRLGSPPEPESTLRQALHSNGKGVLQAEQGLGDQLFFLRWASEWSRSARKCAFNGTVTRAWPHSRRPRPSRLAMSAQPAMRCAYSSPRATCRGSLRPIAPRIHAALAIEADPRARSKPLEALASSAGHRPLCRRRVARRDCLRGRHGREARRRACPWPICAGRLLARWPGHDRMRCSATPSGRARPPATALGPARARCFLVQRGPRAHGRNPLCGRPVCGREQHQRAHRGGGRARGPHPRSPSARMALRKATAIALRGSMVYALVIAKIRPPVGTPRWRRLGAARARRHAMNAASRATTLAALARL